MLSKYDDLLIHQTPYPLETMATTDLRAFDRFFFNLHDTSGEFALDFGGGVYPNLDVMDGFAVAEFDDSQWNLRASRELKGADRAETVIGPLRFEVVEGLRKWRISLAENGYGISFDLEFVARAQPIEYHVNAMKGHWVTVDMHHYNQPGRYSGWLKIGNRSWEVTTDRVYGHRDRSWGVRMGVGGLSPVGRELPGRGLTLWLPAQFEDRCIILHYSEDLQGNPLSCRGAVLYEDGSVSAPFVKLQHDITFDPASRVHKTSTLLITDASGKTERLESRQLLRGIRLSGAGYDGRHGAYRGEAHLEGERWDLKAPSEQLKRGAIGQLVDQLVEYRNGHDVGYGIYQHMIGAGHYRYGVKHPG
ncbi:MAG: hypothetical protein V3V35_03160 [Dehalococcoidia bacterium]